MAATAWATGVYVRHQWERPSKQLGGGAGVRNSSAASCGVAQALSQREDRRVAEYKRSYYESLTRSALTASKQPSLQWCDYQSPRIYSSPRDYQLSSILSTVRPYGLGSNQPIARDQANRTGLILVARAATGEADTDVDNKMDLARAEMRECVDTASTNGTAQAVTGEADADVIKKMDQARAEMREWWSQQQASKAASASTAQPIAVDNAEITGENEEADAEVIKKMDQARAEMREWWSQQQAKKAASASSAQPSTVVNADTNGASEVLAADAATSEADADVIKKMDQARAEMREWWMQQQANKTASKPQAVSSTQLDGVDNTKINGASDILKSAATDETDPAVIKKMDKARAEMREWWMMQQAKKAASAPSASKPKAPSLDTVVASVKSAVQAASEKISEVVKPPSAVEQLIEEEVRAAMRRYAEQKVERERIEMMEMDKARAEMRQWWAENLAARRALRGSVFGWCLIPRAYEVRAEDRPANAPIIQIKGADFIIGAAPTLEKGEDGSAVIDTPKVSSRHARIIATDVVKRGGEIEREFSLVDLNSTNGTWINRSRLRPGAAVKLRPGDVIIFGDQSDERCKYVVRRQAS
eukprot:jgi/Chlat1/4231/Chrsp27S04245